MPSLPARFRAITLPSGIAVTRRSMAGGFPSLLSGKLYDNSVAAARAVDTALAEAAVDGMLRVVREAVTEDPFGELHIIVTQRGVLPTVRGRNRLYYYAVPSPAAPLPLRQQQLPNAGPPPPPLPPPMPSPVSGESPPRDPASILSAAAELSAVGRVERWADRMMVDEEPGQGSSILLGVGAPKVGKTTFLELVPAVVQLRRACHGVRPAVFFQHTFAEGEAPARCMVGLLRDLHAFQVTYGLCATGSSLTDSDKQDPFIAFKTHVPIVARQLASKGFGPFIVIIDECAALLVPPLRSAGEAARVQFRTDCIEYLGALKQILTACQGAHIVCAGSGMIAFLNALVSQGSHGFHMLGDAHIVRLGDSLPPRVAQRIAVELAALAGLADADLPGRIVTALEHPFLSPRIALIADILRRYEEVPLAERRFNDSVAGCVSKMESDMRSDMLASVDDMPTTAMDVLRGLAVDAGWMSGAAARAPASVSGVGGGGTDGVLYPAPLQRMVAAITDFGLPGGRRALQRPYAVYLAMTTGSDAERAIAMDDLRDNPFESQLLLDVSVQLLDSSRAEADVSAIIAQQMALFSMISSPHPTTMAEWDSSRFGKAMQQDFVEAEAEWTRRDVAHTAAREAIADLQRRGSTVPKDLYEARNVTAAAKKNGPNARLTDWNTFWQGNHAASLAARYLLLALRHASAHPVRPGVVPHFLEQSGATKEELKSMLNGVRAALA